MPDIKLRDGSGNEKTYQGIDTITVPLADGTGNYTYGLTDEELTFSDLQHLINNSTAQIFKKDFKRFKFVPTTYNGRVFYELLYFVSDIDKEIDLSDVVIDADGVDLIYVSYAFNSANIKKLPRIINANNLCVGNSSMFTNSVSRITETEVL